jgi:hypothetical protein
MLKVDKIEFWLDDGISSYTINSHQIESFPLIGGTTANVVTTKVWNQHGNTFVESYMDAQDGDLIFTIYTKNKNAMEIEEARKAITQICNPLNGKILMKVYLTSGSIYNRDIVFTSAPAFPVGAENRNDVWQKVQILFEANNPFWYSENEIVETFQAVEPLFEFPFEMSTSAPIEFGNVLPNNVASNNGQVDAPVNITIIGACVNPRIDNITTGEYMKFNNLTMTANDVLEIETAFGQKGVWLNGASIFNKLDFNSTFFSLKPGDNEISFTDDTASPTAAIHFIYKPLFITV